MVHRCGGAILSGPVCPRKFVCVLSSLIWTFSFSSSICNQAWLHMCFLEQSHWATHRLHPLDKASPYSLRSIARCTDMAWLNWRCLTSAQLTVNGRMSSEQSLKALSFYIFPGQDFGMLKWCQQVRWEQRRWLFRKFTLEFVSWFRKGREQSSNFRAHFLPLCLMIL